jgi:hypothetical protein
VIDVFVHVARIVLSQSHLVQLLHKDGVDLRNIGSIMLPDEGSEIPKGFALAK